jgi:magnesium transporter
MNFHFMHELAVPWAYPLALLAMLASAVIPYLVFKWRRRF